MTTRMPTTTTTTTTGLSQSRGTGSSRELSHDELLAMMQAKLLQREENSLLPSGIQATVQERRVAAALVNDQLPRPTLDHLRTAPSIDSRLASIGKSSDTSEEGMIDGVRLLDRARRATVGDRRVGGGAREASVDFAPSLLESQHFVPAAERTRREVNPEEDELMEGAERIPGTEMSRPAVPRAAKDLPENNPFRIVRESISAKSLKMQQESKPAFPGLSFFDPNGGAVGELDRIASAMSLASSSPSSRLAEEPSRSTHERRRSMELKKVSSDVNALHERRAALAKRATELKSRKQPLPGTIPAPKKEASSAAVFKTSDSQAQKLSAMLAAYREDAEASQKRDSRKPNAVGKTFLPSRDFLERRPTAESVRPESPPTPPPADEWITEEEDFPFEPEPEPSSLPKNLFEQDTKDLLRSLFPSAVRDAPPKPERREAKATNRDQTVLAPKSRPVETPRSRLASPPTRNPVSKPKQPQTVSRQRPAEEHSSAEEGDASEDAQSETELKLPMLPATARVEILNRVTKIEAKLAESKGFRLQDEEEDEDEEDEDTKVPVSNARAIALELFKRPERPPIESRKDRPVLPKPHGIAFTVAKSVPKPNPETWEEEEARGATADALARQQQIARRKYFSTMTARVLKERCKRAKIPHQNMTKQQMIDALAVHPGH